jgi:hypothetical protein
MIYPEGGTIPYRITLPQPCVGTSWSITLQFDFADNATGVHFVDFLTSYNAYEGSVNGHACDDGSCTSKSTFPIPADGDLSYQLPGVFTVENGAITSVSALLERHRRPHHGEGHYAAWHGDAGRRRHDPLRRPPGA